MSQDVLKVSCKEFKRAYKKMKEWESKVNKMKECLLKEFENNGITKCENVVYVKSSTRDDLDVKLLKETDMDMYWSLLRYYGKKVTTSPTLRVLGRKNNG